MLLFDFHAKGFHLIPFWYKGTFEIQSFLIILDTNYLLKALSSKSSTIDIGHAGTAMRFLTSYFSLTTKKEIELRGSQRMHNRPIKILVDSLREIGASIHYIDKEGYPPLLIKPSKLISKNLIIDSSTC